MKLKDIPTNDLKALAYDNIAQLEQIQSNLKVINSELASRAQNTQTQPTMEENTPAVEETTETAPEMEATEETVETTA